MALIVKLNTRIKSPSLGVIQADNSSYWDPVTGVNLNRGNSQSGDLSAFSSTQLANIANAVDSGILTLVSGSLPAATQSFNTYSTIFHPASAGGDSSHGITSVAALSALQDNTGDQGLDSV